MGVKTVLLRLLTRSISALARLPLAQVLRRRLSAISLVLRQLRRLLLLNPGPSGCHSVFSLVFTGSKEVAFSSERPRGPRPRLQPAADWGGFVFSEPELLARYDRQLRYENAREYCRTGKDPRPKPQTEPKIDMAA